MCIDCIGLLGHLSLAQQAKMQYIIYYTHSHSCKKCQILEILYPKKLGQLYGHLTSPSEVMRHWQPEVHSECYTFTYMTALAQEFAIKQLIIIVEHCVYSYCGYLAQTSYNKLLQAT